MGESDKAEKRDTSESEPLRESGGESTIDGEIDSALRPVGTVGLRLGTDRACFIMDFGFVLVALLVTAGVAANMSSLKSGMVHSASPRASLTPRTGEREPRFVGDLAEACARRGEEAGDAERRRGEAGSDRPSGGGARQRKASEREGRRKWAGAVFVPALTPKRGAASTEVSGMETRVLTVRGMRGEEGRDRRRGGCRRAPRRVWCEVVSARVIQRDSSVRMGMTYVGREEHTGTKGERARASGRWAAASTGRHESCQIRLGVLRHVDGGDEGEELLRRHLELALKTFCAMWWRSVGRVHKMWSGAFVACVAHLYRSHSTSHALCASQAAVARLEVWYTQRETTAQHGLCADRCGGFLWERSVDGWIDVRCQ